MSIYTLQIESSLKVKLGIEILEKIMFELTKEDGKRR